MAKDDLLVGIRQELRRIRTLLKGEPNVEALRQAIDHYPLLLAMINSQIARLLIGVYYTQIRFLPPIDDALARGWLAGPGDLPIASAELEFWRKLAATGEPAIAAMLEKAAATATDQCLCITALGRRT